jgi:hypothetical protein
MMRVTHPAPEGGAFAILQASGISLASYQAESFRSRGYKGGPRCSDIFRTNKVSSGGIAAIDTGERLLRFPIGLMDRSTFLDKSNGCYADRRRQPRGLRRLFVASTRFADMRQVAIALREPAALATISLAMQ